MSQMTIISGIERRRSWTAEQKLALVEEAFSPGVCVADVARRADIRTNQFYRWRDRFISEAREGEGLAVVLAQGSSDDGGGSSRDRSIMVVEQLARLIEGLDWRQAIVHGEAVTPTLA